MKISVRDLLVALTLTLGAAASAAPRWRLVEPQHVLGEVCVASSTHQVRYHRLAAGEATSLQVRGPRRLKIVTRYVFGPEKSLAANYTVTAVIDGRDALDQTVTTHTAKDLATCREGARLGVLRRFYLDVPAGLHTVETTAQAPGGGAVAARFFRERRQRSIEWASYAPERFLSVAHLQFESGKRSTYYLFDMDHPLSCKLSGPATLEIWTRLDFPQAMVGSQLYAVEVRLDGRQYRNFHYDTTKLDGAEWLERPSILPGQRRRLTLSVPRGSHRITLHCLRPDACGIAAKLRIPVGDIR